MAHKPDFLRSNQPLGPVLKNIGALLAENAARFAALPAVAEKENGAFSYRNWEILYRDILKFSLYLSSLGLQPEDRVAFITKKSYSRLAAELAVMAMGFTSVPIFKGYPEKTKSDLLVFCEPRLIVTDDETERTGPFILKQFQSLPDSYAQTPALENQMLAVESERTAIILFTSGTSGFPKGVMLTHSNILTQQKANALLWKPKEGLRFLSHLPWDHVFGSLFERFFALSSGGCLCLDDSDGKDLDLLLRNFREIKPPIFFSVPLVYERMAKSGGEQFIHPGLQFLFTAAAPLPSDVSKFYQGKKVPFVEGWGLTEASPSCTLTPPSLERAPGNVGYPIPGVEIRLSVDGEVLVKGPNVMKGYFNSPEATRAAIDAEGWLHTGDCGEIGAEGLRILGRMDRVFKLSNGKKISAQVLEDRLKSHCRLAKYVFVFGNGLKAPMALIFPDFGLVAANELENRLPSFSHALHEANAAAGAKYERIEKALVLQADFSPEAGDFTPSMKLKYEAFEMKFEIQIRRLAAGEGSIEGGFQLEPAPLKN